MQNPSSRTGWWPLLWYLLPLVLFGWHAWGYHDWLRSLPADELRCGMPALGLLFGPPTLAALISAALLLHGLLCHATQPKPRDRGALLRRMQVISAGMALTISVAFVGTALL
ncbi:hypothetical protein SAMN02745857_00194 [Andreprevotia lacus DSM 23236]|jgi:hypothetical protein|uniref:Uncharacterized protein n=1 Tax=Andreprevotia lacus DSM 23236 TaxID=1121001 RepID=A0A1W1WXK5_9NEIS|nr:hypothetical protein [Andreprevotia lacus]SMC16452.1 hypothetical protein SAMN02745857_00194 [Andreprevotia lacus DSM 23236]